MGYDLARKPRLLYTGRKQSDQEVVKGDSSSHTVSLLKLSFFHSMEQLRNRYVSLFPPTSYQNLWDTQGIPKPQQ